VDPDKGSPGGADVCSADLIAASILITTRWDRLRVMFMVAKLIFMTVKA